MGNGYESATTAHGEFQPLYTDVDRVVINLKSEGTDENESATITFDPEDSSDGTCEEDVSRRDATPAREGPVVHL